MPFNSEKAEELIFLFDEKDAFLIFNFLFQNDQKNYPEKIFNKF